MVNEEDHLRMQVMRSGLQLSEAFDQINRIDDILYTLMPDMSFIRDVKAANKRKQEGEIQMGKRARLPGQGRRK